MKDRITKLARGIVDSDVPKLQMSVSSFQGSFPPGEIHNINTVLSSQNDVMLKGLIYSTHPRVRAEKDAFGGLRSRIGCEVNTEGMRDGDTIEGMLTIVSNAGEWQLPYLFFVRGKAAEKEAVSESFVIEKGDYPYMAAEETEIEEENSDFSSYLQLVKEGSSELYLFEHLLETMPKQYGEELPREVYLYFDYAKSLEKGLALRLYSNILRAFSADSDIYQRYERRMQEFAMTALLEQKMDEDYALLYQKLLYPDMVDPRMLRVLPRMLRTYRISVQADGLKQIIVRYPEFEKERRYPIEGREAYLPLLFPDAEILFMDREERYWCLPYKKELLLDREDLKEKCREVGGEYQLSSVRGILRSGIQKKSQLEQCEAVFDEPGLSESFRREIAVGILRFHARMNFTERELLTEKDREFLRQLPAELLDTEGLTELLRSLLRIQDYERATELYRQYGNLKLERDLLEQLFCYQIRKLAEEGEERVDRRAVSDLTAGIYQVFKAGSRKKELLHYLLLHYNSVSWNMLEVLKKSVDTARMQQEKTFSVRELPTEEKQDIHQMAERLLAQMLFTGMEEGMEEVHSYYEDSGDSDILLEKAYITKKASIYFLRNRKADKEFFELLYSLIHRENIKDRIPIIYLLAMSKYMSEQQSLSDEEKLELQEIMNVLTEKKLIFAYTEKLRSFIPLPDSVNRSYIEYHSESGEKPVLYVKILPDEKEFHEEEIERVYQNIYVCPLLLFRGEQAVYKICRVGEEIPVQQGSIELSHERNLNSRGDTYDILNEMSELLETGDYRGLREAMLHYTRNEAMVQKLFAKGDKKQ